MAIVLVGGRGGMLPEPAREVHRPEQDWFWVALLRAALEEREKREKVKSVKRALVALLRLEPAPWRGCFRYGESRSFGAREFLHIFQDSKTPGSGSNGRRVAGCGAETVARCRFPVPNWDWQLGIGNAITLATLPAACAGRSPNQTTILTRPSPEFGAKRTLRPLPPLRVALC